MLHRGTEKLIEHKNYLQALPYFDRLDGWEAWMLLYIRNYSVNSVYYLQSKVYQVLCWYFSLLKSRKFFFGYSRLGHVFGRVRLYERFNVNLGIKYILFYSMYRATHLNRTLQNFPVNKDDDRYESGTEGGKHILQIVANGVLWLNCRNTTIIKVSQVFSRINIYFYLSFRSLCHLFLKGVKIGE